MICWSEKPGNPSLCSTFKLNSQGFTEDTIIHRGHKDSQRSQGFPEVTRFEVSGAGSRVWLTDWRRRVPQPDCGGGTLEAGTRHTGTAEEAGRERPRDQAHGTQRLTKPAQRDGTGTADRILAGRATGTPPLCITCTLRSVPVVAVVRRIS